MDDHEFVAPQTRQCICCTERMAQAQRKFLEYRVSGFMTVFVVDFLEAIDVQIQQGQPRLVSRTAFYRLAYAIIENMTIGHSR